MGGRPRRLRRARAGAARPRDRRRLALALAGGAVALAIGLSPAGAKVGDAGRATWSGSARRTRGRRCARCPAAGELLVDSEQGVWIVARGRLEAAARRLRRGDAGRRTALYVAAAAGRAAGRARARRRRPLDATRRRATSATRAGRGTAVDTRIAYRSGDDLRVIAGDGSGASDHLIARNVAPVAPGLAADRRRVEARRRSAARSYVLSYVDGDGRAAHASTPTPAPRVPTTSATTSGSPSPAPRRGLRGPGASPDGSRRWRASGPPAARDELVLDRHRRGGGASPVLRPRPSHRADLVARRPLAAGRLAGGRPVAVHRRRPPAPRRRLRPRSPSSSTPAATAPAASPASTAGSCPSADPRRG